MAWPAGGERHQQGAAPLPPPKIAPRFILFNRSLPTTSKVVVSMGEFGRTPRVNKNAGRDHWGSVMSVMLDGGGLQRGIVGASNSRGEVPAANAYRPENVLAMIYRHLGIDLSSETINNAGRPIPLLPSGRPIAELI